MAAGIGLGKDGVGACLSISDGVDGGRLAVDARARDAQGQLGIKPPAAGRADRAVALGDHHFAHGRVKGKDYREGLAVLRLVKGLGGRVHAVRQR